MRVDLAPCLARALNIVAGRSISWRFETDGTAAPFAFSWDADACQGHQTWLQKIAWSTHVCAFLSPFSRDTGIQQVPARRIRNKLLKLPVKEEEGARTAASIVVWRSCTVHAIVRAKEGWVGATTPSQATMAEGAHRSRRALNPVCMAVNRQRRAGMCGKELGHGRRFAKDHRARRILAQLLTAPACYASKADRGPIASVTARAIDCLEHAVRTKAALPPSIRQSGRRGSRNAGCSWMGRGRGEKPRGWVPEVGTWWQNLEQ